MISMLQFATLVITTVFAVAAAAGLHWVCLKAAFVLMRPATARRIPDADGIGAWDGATGSGLLGFAVSGVEWWRRRRSTGGQAPPLRNRKSLQDAGATRTKLPT